MPNKQNTQQEIPFKMEGNTAPRSLIRASEDITNTDGLYKIAFPIIRINPGFQPRIKPAGLSEELWERFLDIPGLADAIYENNGPLDPLIGDIYKEDGCFYITEGERRFRAIRHLLAKNYLIYPNGADVSEVRILLNPAGTTDKERKRMALSSENKMKFTVMQRARYYKKFEVEDGMTHQEISDYLQGISRQTIDNYILCLELSEDVQDKLDGGVLTISAALAEYRESHKKKKGDLAVVDPETGEVVSSYQEKKDADAAKEKEKLRGDEDEFEQKDNSITSPGSRGGPKEEGSGAHVAGRDSIYMDQQKLALWKQFVNRYEILKNKILLHIDLVPKDTIKALEDELAERLNNEYNLTVK